MNLKHYFLRRHVLLGAGALGFYIARTAPANAASVGDINQTPGLIDVKGHLPNLSFQMERTSDGQSVSAANYQGDVVIVYFGFTRCTDTCPLTVMNAARLISSLDTVANRVRFLFVTVDLNYDTPERLKRYLAQFGPPPYIDGLYGTPTTLDFFAKRFGVFFKAPRSPNAPDPQAGIRHSDAVFLFNPAGQAVAIINDFGDGNPHLRSLSALVKELLTG